MRVHTRAHTHNHSLHAHITAHMWIEVKGQHKGIASLLALCGPGIEQGLSALAALELLSCLSLPTSTAFK